MLGTCLHERYTLSKVLRHRNDQQTYLAWDNNRRAQVVVKVLPFSYGFDWDNLKHFERETQLLKQLSHPAIPQYLDGFEIDLPNFKGFAWVQTYIASKSLAEHVQQGRTFSEADLTQIATALLEVLTFLHGRNPAIIHRDVKPSNVLLSDRTAHSCGNVHLIDFGTVQTGVSQQEGTVTVAGTYGYGAPEQFRGDAIPASDLYGVGMTLVHLITGTNPGRLPVRNGRVIFESGHLSDRFSNWTKGMTHAEPHKRFKSSAIALETLTRTDFALSQLSTHHQQPEGSKLTFSKTSQALSLTIPPIGFPYEKIGGFVFMTGFKSMFVGVLAIPIIGWWIGWIMFRGSWLRLVDILLDTFGYTYLNITPSEVILITKWVGLTRNKHIISTNVDKLERIAPQVFVKRIDERVVNRFVPPSLRIHADNQTLQITASAAVINGVHKKARLTEAELDWLAVELSEWFDVPIERQALAVRDEPTKTHSAKKAV